MSCNTLLSLQKDCSSNIGGIRELYFILLSDIETLDIEDDYTVSDITVSTPFVKYDIPLNSTSYNVEYSTDELGIQEFIHGLTIRISKRRPLNNQILKRMLDGNRDLVAMVKDSNGRYWLLGYRNGLNIPSGSGGSGTTKSEGTFYTFELTGLEQDFEVEISESFIPSIT